MSLKTDLSWLYESQGALVTKHDFVVAVLNAGVHVFSENHENIAASLNADIFAVSLNTTCRGCRNAGGHVFFLLFFLSVTKR